MTTWTHLKVHYNYKRKVQFDLRFYFCKRGCENMDKMLKTDFEIKYSTEHEEWFVIKVRDELTKNHRQMENIVSGVMPENKTDELCPVKSFRKYLSHLHPDNKFMWQYTLDKIDPQKPNIWYSRKNIGKNPLASFMSEVSRKCNLSQIYTNHSIRVTGCTVLTRCKFSNSEIMAVSGHKSVQSLAIYQKTKQKEKVKMGKVLFQSMTRKEEDIDVNQKVKEIEAPPQKQAIMPPPRLQVAEMPSCNMAVRSENATTPIFPHENKENAATALLPFEANFNEDDVSDMDILSAICGVNKNTTTTVSNTSNIMTNMPRAMFANCQIWSINITFSKKWLTQGNIIWTILCEKLLICWKKYFLSQIYIHFMTCMRSTVTHIETSKILRITKIFIVTYFSMLLVSI